MHDTEKLLRLAVLGLASTALVACSSGTDNSSSDPTDPPAVVGETDGADGGNTDGTVGGTDGSNPGVTTGGDAGGDDGATPDPGNTDGSGGDGGTTDSTGGADGASDGSGSTDGGATDGSGGQVTGAGGAGTASEVNTNSEGEMPPTLDDPFAPPVPGPSLDDPFLYGFEEDNEAPTAGGPPTTPKNLRVDLVSNDWAEINWAPSNDDVEVVAYKVYRSDGVVYDVTRDQTSPNGGTQLELTKYWRTTAFIDCNYTRFSDSIHNCNVNGPEPGETYSYTVSAIDNEGQESPRSNIVTIRYHDDRGAPVPRYEDPYLGAGDDFAQRNDLSETRFFLDEFSTMFEDEFQGNTIDDTKWTTGLTWGDTRIINGEQQYFVNTQTQPDFGYNPFKFTGESLIIEAIPVPDELRSSLPPICDEPDPTGLDRCEFLSGALSSHGPSGSKYQFIYGYTEARMRVSDVAGALSSFYLYHRYPGEGIRRHSPEIDIIEYLGENPFGDEDAFQTYHYQDQLEDTGLIRSSPTMSFENPQGDLYSDDWHTFGALWEPGLVIWYIDGVEVKRLSGPQVSRQPMNIVNYLVAGSGWAPTPDASNPDLFPIQFEVDYIRVMQRQAYQSTSSYGG